jgi:hypothetical protein
VELKVHLYILFDLLMTIALRQEYSIDVAITVFAEQETTPSSHHEFSDGEHSIRPLLTTYLRFLCSLINLLQTAGGEGGR